MRRNKLRLYIHFVWATRDRLPLISEDIERDLYRYLAKGCEENGCSVVAAGGTNNHIHLLVTLSNTITIADLMKHLKGGSSRFVSEKLKGGDWFAWQGSYGAFTVSPRHKEKVIEYILNQKQHHAADSLWLEAEETYEELSSIETSD